MLGYNVNTDYYKDLTVPPEATAQEVETAFKEQTASIDLKCDIQSERLLGAEKMLNLTKAYEILSDPIQRSHYDINKFGRAELPSTEQVKELFRAGIKAFKQERLDLALRYFKEVTYLYPHRSLYRVHLAIIYAEKEWTANAENELHTALRLDPDDRFAKETIARTLFLVDVDVRKFPKESLVKRMGTGILSLVKTGQLGPNQTHNLENKKTNRF